jgi:hypothetical protein
MLENSGVWGRDKGMCPARRERLPGDLHGPCFTRRQVGSGIRAELPPRSGLKYVQIPRYAERTEMDSTWFPHADI